MDPTGEEQLDFEDEEFGVSQKMPYHGGGAISALAEDEIIGEDDEYDDLYNDVNVGEGFRQLQRSEAPGPSVGVTNGGFQTQKTIVPELKAENVVPQALNIHEVATDGKYTSSGLQVLEPKGRLAAEGGPNMGTINISQRGSAPDMTHDAQALNLGFRGTVPVGQNIGIEPVDMSGKVTNEPVPLLNPGAGVPRGVPQMPSNQTNVNVNRPVVNDNQIRPVVDNGATMLFVGELHWWTTDAELESVLSQYGRVKEIKFFDERASGKSKGYCQVEFYDSAAATACKEGMNGYIFNGRACVVAFASPQTIKQMGASYANKSQVQSQSQQQGRRPMNDGAGRGGGTSYPSGDAGRGFGRGGWARGQGAINRGGGHMRGRGGSIGAKNMIGNAPGVGAGANGGGYGQGLPGPTFGGPPGGFMHPQGMMGTGFDPTYMGRGSGYGGFPPGPAFHGMLPPFPNVNAMGLAGVAPHVNPAFFGRGMTPNGMGMMGNTGMDGPPAAMWNDTTMDGWGAEEHGQRTRESSYGGEDGGSEYGYGEPSHDKGVRSNAASREKERGSERDWSGNSEKRHRDERDQDRDRYDREHRYKDRYDREHKYREEKEDYRDHRHKERDLAYGDDRDRGQSSSRSRSRSRAMPEEDHRSRSKDGDYGKRRRGPSD